MNKSDIVKIIDSFAADGRVFSNEFDFQFALSNEIKSLPNVEDVFFEVASFNKGVSSGNLNSLSKPTKNILI